MSANGEIVVLSGGAMRRFMTEAIPLFERASGFRVAIRYALTREMEAEIEAGAAFDVALLPHSAIEALVKSGKIASGTPIDVVRSFVGLMVRTGTPEPDVGTVDKFIGVLRRAKSISLQHGPEWAVCRRSRLEARAFRRNEGKNHTRHRPSGRRGDCRRRSRNRYAADHRKSAGGGGPSSRAAAGGTRQLRCLYGRICRRGSG